MIAGLRAMQALRPFTLEIIDVDSDPALEARYGEFVLFNPLPNLLHSRRYDLG